MYPSIIPQLCAYRLDSLYLVRQQILKKKNFELKPAVLHSKTDLLMGKGLDKYIDYSRLLAGDTLKMSVVLNHM